MCHAMVAGLNGYSTRKIVSSRLSDCAAVTDVKNRSITRADEFTKPDGEGDWYQSAGQLMVYSVVSHRSG